MRTEYLGRLMDSLAQRSEQWRSYYLDEMSAEQMHQAILLPTATEPIPYAGEIPRQKYNIRSNRSWRENWCMRRVKRPKKIAKVRWPCCKLFAQHLDRMTKRRDHMITKADHKSQGPAENAVVDAVPKKSRACPWVPAISKCCGN